MISFKSAVIYDLVDTDALEQNLNAAIKPLAYRPLAVGQMALYSFAPFNELGEPIYVLEINANAVAFKINYAKRHIPQKVIDKEFKTRIKAMMDKLQRKLKKAEKDNIRDEIMTALMEKAFIVEKEYLVFVDKQTKQIFVNVASEKNAEDCFALLRKALGGLPVRPISFEANISQKLRQVFLDNQVILNDGTILTVSPNFKLTELEEIKRNITNRETELSLDKLRDMVQQNLYEVNILGFIEESIEARKLEYQIKAPQIGKNGLNYQGIKLPLFKEALGVHTENLPKDQEEKLDYEILHFSANEYLSTLHKIAEYSNQLFVNQ